ncbi:MAG: DeoR/GlpR transcriptional regulator [Ruminococcaceae bacterium]|nr:DeoR/GlpR transcriptional regulator [Oscillospiraceae bacterium]
MGMNQRQKDILDWVNQKQRVSVTFLAQTLFFSEMTIRRDLIKLENEGYLKRYHGGAMALSLTELYPIEQRMFINEHEKRDIAKYAEKHLRDNQTIFLPGSSTCAYLLPFMKNYSGLHIITNSVQFLVTLSEMNIRCTISGGEYYAAEKVLVGHAANHFFRSMNYDIAFQGCDGITEDGQISVVREHAAELFRISFTNAEKHIIIADHSKYGVRCTYNVCRVDDADEVIMI